ANGRFHPQADLYSSPQPDQQRATEADARFVVTGGRAIQKMLVEHVRKVVARFEMTDPNTLGFTLVRWSSLSCSQALFSNLK
ncbi:MAG: hypothetical protein WBM58_05275, partial [Sedimenticolaceae bacterium]